jgi:hypothetical protein
MCKEFVPGAVVASLSGDPFRGRKLDPAPLEDRLGTMPALSPIPAAVAAMIAA